jgi:two-component system nitrogen regulation sensor histidine kinase NtrY
LANIVAALREGDYSLRARSAPLANDSLGQLSLEINLLAELLGQQQTAAIEASALLQSVVEEVDIPIFAFDPKNSLRLVNPAGERLLQTTAEEAMGKTASALRLQSALSSNNETVVQLEFNSGARWFLRKSGFRRQGVPHTLLVLSDVSRALREEERQAWQRLIRVMGHELNNSLAPIKSIAGSLSARISTLPIDDEQRKDFERGLGIIENRAASLNRFLQAYRRLAQLPPPALQKCRIEELVNRASALESRVPVTVVAGPNVSLMADPDQLEQMLINLLRNAAESVITVPQESPDCSPSLSGEPEPPILFTWKLVDKNVILTIEDSGSGLLNSGNTFVPFYTTKEEGSGIGLVFSRQICEAHGGSIELANRIGRRGCAVKITLPLTK